jgi:hypothetical protein
MGKRIYRQISKFTRISFVGDNPDSYLLCKHEKCIRLTKEEVLELGVYTNKLKLRGEI